MRLTHLWPFLPLSLPPITLPAQAAMDDSSLVRGVQVMNISLRMLHTSKQAAWQRPLVAALQDTLRTTALGPWFFSQIANPKVRAATAGGAGREGLAGTGAAQGPACPPPPAPFPTRPPRPRPLRLAAPRA